MREIRFLFDEHIDSAIASRLQRDGIDVLTAGDAGLLTKPDVAYRELAQATGRVLVTHDLGFVRWARHNTGHPGIAFCKMNTKSIAQIIDSLERIWNSFGSNDMIGQVKYL